MFKPLCLDLGTTTGFAVGSMGVAMSGTWNLKPGRFDGGGMRFVKFRARLAELKDAWSPTHVFFEEVRRHQGVDAAHVYGGLMAVLTAWCEEHEIPYSSYPVGTIKKSWAGNGNASKQQMMDEAKRRGFEPADDNEADALAIFHLALTEYAASEMKAAAE